MTSTLDDRASKRIRKEEPDVTIIVGGKEFRHYRQILCVASDYFDAAFNSGMKESDTMRIEFPDKDPDEWELFVSFLEPFTTAEITNSNVEVLVPWFHEFGITTMLNKCDCVFHDKSFPGGKKPLWTFILTNIDKKLSRSELHVARTEVERLANICNFSVIYGLASTLKKAQRCLCRIVGFNKGIFDLKCVSRIVSLLQYEEIRDYYLWDIIKNRYLPRALKDKDPELLISNDLFPPLLLARMKNHKVESDDE